MGVIFVEELDQCFDDCLVVFFVYGVFKSVLVEVVCCDMIYVDVICLLVFKVYVEVQCYFNNGYDILLIGYVGYLEVIGIMG